MSDAASGLPGERDVRQAGSMATKPRGLSIGVNSAFIVILSSLMISNMVYHLVLADTFTEQLTSASGIMLFIVLSVIPYGAACYLFRKFINPLNKEVASSFTASQRYFRITYKILIISFFYNAALLGIITFQIITESQYNLGFTILSMQANAIFPILVGAFLGYKFISWYRSSHDLMLLFFGIAFVCMAAGFVTTNAAQTVSFLMDEPARTEVSHEIQASQQGSGYYQLNNVKADPLYRSLFLTTGIPLRIAFVPYWIATVLLLRKYAKKIGKIRYWLLASFPLATYIIATIFIFSGFGTQLLRGIVMPTAQLSGGILFSLIFLTIAKTLRNGNQQISDEGQSNRTRLDSHLMMSAYGIILILIVSTPPNHIIDWIHTPYPPFANVVWSFMGFAAYLYGFGLYFSTVAISQDTRLRKSIYKLAAEEADLLRSLGSTRMKEELQKRVAKLSKEQEEVLMENTGVEQHLSDSEIQNYVKEVMNEVQKVSKK